MPAAEVARPAGPIPAPPRWRALALLALYHLVLGAGLLVLQAGGVFDTPGLAHPALFGNVAWVLVAAAAAMLVFALLQRPRFGPQIHAVLLLDIAALTLLLHAGGGVDSGAGLLLAVSLAIGLPLTGGIWPFFFAALATCAVNIPPLAVHIAQRTPKADVNG